VKFKKGDKEPVPKIGDRFYIDFIYDKGYYVVEHCDCSCVKPERRWPSPLWIGSCGPHFINEKSPNKRYIFFICSGDGDGKWDYDGELISSDSTITNKGLSSCPHSRTKKVPLGLGGNCEIIEVCCDCGEEV
jgi:hypothetical protein